MRLIDGDKAYQDIYDIACNLVNYPEGQAVAEAFHDASHIIEKMPTVEVGSIKHGYWITHKDEHQCSVCGEIVCEEVYDKDGNWGSQGIYDFCPYCGAKMDEDN